MTTVVGTLTEEDLGRWRMAQARMHAITKKPESFGTGDVEQSFLAIARMRGDFCARYSVDDSRNWVVSCNTGLVYYTD